jgi:hypothetical protein
MFGIEMTECSPRPLLWRVRAFWASQKGEQEKMLKLQLPTGQELVIENLFDEVFSTEDLQGVQYHWNVTKGRKLAEKRGEVHIISLSQMGVTIERIRQQYDGMNEFYALTTDISKPLLFVPLKGEDQLLDGWHRLFHAAFLGVDELPAYILTQEEADSCLMFTLPPEHGIDWGQKSKATPITPICPITPVSSELEAPYGT